MEFDKYSVAQLMFSFHINDSESQLHNLFAFDHDSNFYVQVNVSISSSNSYCIEVVLRCLAVEGDGLRSHDLNDGGILGTVMAAGFKGEEYY